MKMLYNQFLMQYIQKTVNIVYRYLNSCKLNQLLRTTMYKDPSDIEVIAKGLAINDPKVITTKELSLYSQILEDVNNLMGLYMSFSAQKTNEVMKVLTVFSVFFMPLTFIVGIYGMNFEFMPELKWTFGYPLVLMLMIVVATGIYLWFRKKNWL